MTGLYILLNYSLSQSLINAKGGEGLQYMLYIPVFWIIYIILLSIMLGIYRNRYCNSVFYKVFILINTAITIFFMVNLFVKIN